MQKLVEIRFKSGHMISEWFDRFDVQSFKSSILRIDWTTSVPGQAIEYLNLSEVESIFIKETKEV